MKKQISFILLLITAMLIFTACSEQASNGDLPMATETPTPAENSEPASTPEDEHDEDKNTVDTTDQPGEITQSKPTVSFKELEFPWEKVDRFGDGFIAFQDPDTELWGYSSYDGQVVIDAQYKFADTFYQGYGFVSTDTGRNYIDKTGKVLYAGSFRAGVEIPFTKKTDYAYIEDDFKYYLIDKSGRIISTDDTFTHHDGVNKDGKSEFEFNTYTSELVFDRSVKYNAYDIHRGLELTTIQDKSSNIVVNGADILSKFPDTTGIGFTDDYIVVIQAKLSGESGVHYSILTSHLVDYNLNTIIDSTQYSYIIPLDKEHIIVATYDKKYGLINSKGEFLIELSDKVINLMLDEPEEYVHNHGMLFFQPNGGSENAQYLYQYHIVNNTGSDLILIIDEGDSTSSASFEVYDLNQNKVVRRMNSFSLSHQAPIMYLLDGFTLATGPFECYDYEGNSFPKGILPDMGYRLENVYLEDGITYLELTGWGDKPMFIQVLQK